MLDPIARGCVVEDESGIPCLRFDDEAQAFFDEWRTRLEERLRSGRLSGLMATHLSKYRSLMPSLALIFHLVECCQEPTFGPVRLYSVELAAAWCDLLEDHAARIYRAAMEGDPDIAIRLSERLADSLPEPFTVRRHLPQAVVGPDDLRGRPGGPRRAGGSQLDQDGRGPHDGARGPADRR